jgi:hypothetical protein
MEEQAMPPQLIKTVFYPQVDIVVSEKIHAKAACV